MSALFDLLSAAVADYQPTSTWEATTFTPEMLHQAMEHIRDYRVPRHGTPESPHVFHPLEFERAKTDPDLTAQCANCGGVFPLGLWAEAQRSP